MDLLKLLLDPDRLAVAGALAASNGPIAAAEIAAFTGVAHREVLLTIAALIDLGVASRDGGAYRIEPPGLQAIAQQVAVVREPPDVRIGFGMTTAEREVLGQYFEGARLTEIPMKRSRRLVVLERLALEFEPGRRYAEHEVNSILGAYNPDWSALRRYLVDEGLLDRANNQYWRSGGRVE